MVRLVVIGLLLSVAGAASADYDNALDVRKGYGYYYTGYYNYRQAPSVVVPNFRLSSSGYSYMYSPYYYGYMPTGWYGQPIIKRAWSLGYMSDGRTGAYYY